MGRKRGVVTTAVLCVNYKRNIKHPRLQLCIFSVASQNPQNIFCSGQLRIRITDDEALVIVVMLVRMICINRCQRHRRNQSQRLTQYILNGNIIRILIIRIQGQYASLQRIHDVQTRCLHDDITHKFARKLPVLVQQINKFPQLLLVRQRTEQKEVRNFLEVEPSLLKALFQIHDIVALIVQFTFTRHLLALYGLKTGNIRNLSQTGQDSFSI